MSIDRMEHTGFTSGEVQGRMRVPRYVGGVIGNSARKGARRMRHTAVWPRAGGILVKAGLCAAVCAGVLFLRWAESQDNAVIPTVSLQQVLDDIGVDAQGTDFDDTLGRLRFVELPSIIEVFSTSAKPDLGVDYESANLDEESLLATFILDHAQQIHVPAACKVKEVGEDPSLGIYIRLSLTEADNEVVYYGLSEIVVEEGQQLATKDTLAQAEGSFVLAVYSAGRPANPLAYFGLDEERV
ncbi:MAG: hypothetical protein EOM66_05030 [Clostridia bacterium]|nr:hypothetical protein [Clostridia bacterium]